MTLPDVFRYLGNRLIVNMVEQFSRFIEVSYGEYLAMEFVACRRVEGEPESSSKVENVLDEMWWRAESSGSRSRGCP